MNRRNRLTDLAARIREHADGAILRISDVESMEDYCYRTIEEAGPFDDRNVAFANLLLDTLFQIRKGEGVAKPLRI